MAGGRFSVEAIFKAKDRITAPVSRMQNRIGKFTRSASAGFNKLNRSVDRVSGKLSSIGGKIGKTAAVGLGLVTASAGYLLHEFSKIENAEAAFTPLMGGAKRAKNLVDALNETAATTPFRFQDLADSAKQLLPVMDGDINRTIQTLRMLGDTAGGNAQKLDSITRGFMKAMLKGKVDMESLNMIAEAGVPIFDDLAAVMGTKVNAGFFKMISAGKVTTDALTKAFEKMTRSGGKFFNGMEISSRTTSGMFSTLMDNISLTASVLGSVLAPAAKEFMSWAIKTAGAVRKWVEQNRAIISEKFNKFLVAAKTAIIGFYENVIKSGKAVKIFSAVSEKLRTLYENGAVVWAWMKRIGIALAAFYTFAAVLKVITVAMAALNLVMSLNPIGLIIIGVSALIGLIVLVVKNWDTLKASFLSLPGPAKAAITALSGPIGWLAGAAMMVKENWDIMATAVSDSLDWITNKIVKTAEAYGRFSSGDFSGSWESIKGLFGDDTAATRAQVVSPQERTARSIEERNSTMKSEVTIKDQTGRAEVTGGKLGPGLTLQATGAF